MISKILIFYLTVGTFKIKGLDIDILNKNYTVIKIKTIIQRNIQRISGFIFKTRKTNKITKTLLDYIVKKRQKQKKMDEILK